MGNSLRIIIDSIFFASFFSFCEYMFLDFGLNSQEQQSTAFILAAILYAVFAFIFRKKLYKQKN